MALPATEAALRRGIEEGRHPGAQLSVRLAGAPPVDLAVGEAARGRPMTADTLLPWFSATKALTALAVLQQWERGRLDLDDPVAAHVPEFGAAGKGAVTVRHLLTHTAGLAAATPTDDRWEVLLSVACASTLVAGWVPGRRAAYSPRLGYHVLGELVQRLDGRAYDAYVNEEVLEPLGMADSWVALSAERRRAYGDRMAVVYDTAGSRRRVVDTLTRPDAFASARPSSSGVGPARELVRLFEALLAKGELDGVRVLSTTATEAMRARHRAGLFDESFQAVVDWGLGVMCNSWHYQRSPAPYGYGEHASPRAFGHGGNQSSVSFADPEAGLAAVVAFNGLAGEAGHHARTQPVLTALYKDLELA